MQGITMNAPLRLLIAALFLAAPLNICSATSSTPTKGKIYHPGTQEHFTDALASNDLIVVDFFAEWCGPCKQLHKVFEDLATDKDCDNVLFIKVDTERQRGISNQYGITSLPTIILFVDGKQIKRLSGYHSKKELKAIIKETFATKKA
jgi:thioredoxin 1